MRLGTVHSRILDAKSYCSGSVDGSGDLFPRAARDLFRRLRTIGDEPPVRYGAVVTPRGFTLARMNSMIESIGVPG